METRARYSKMRNCHDVLSASKILRALWPDRARGIAWRGHPVGRRRTLNNTVAPAILCDGPCGDTTKHLSARSRLVPCSPSI